MPVFIVPPVRDSYKSEVLIQPVVVLTLEVETGNPPMPTRLTQITYYTSTSPHLVESRVVTSLFFESCLPIIFQYCHKNAQKIHF